MGEYAAKNLESFCKGSTVYNAAIGGTTAVQWTGDGHLDALGTTKCGGTPDYIWLSVGGNDVLNTGCGDTEDQASITAKVTASINAVKAKAPGVKILMTGYCMPQSAERRLFDESESGKHDRRLACTSPANFAMLGNAIKAAAEAYSMVTFVDGTTACGGSKTAWSNKRYFADAIHLNKQGYCKMFTPPKVQEFFGCETATYDCESLSCATTGFGSHSCGDGGMTECPGCMENCIFSPAGSSSTTSGTTSGNSSTAATGASALVSGVAQDASASQGLALTAFYVLACSAFTYVM